jgi:hypothetical protein
VRRVLAVLALATVFCAGGCGGSHRASTVSAAPTVVDGACQSFALRGQGGSQSCTFVLSDGERFSCGQPFKGHTPTARQLERSGCRRLVSLQLSGAELALISRLDRARTCLTAKGLRAIGGPVLPTAKAPPSGAADKSKSPGGAVLVPGAPASSSQPGGELVISSIHPTFIAFYADAAQAARIEPTLMRQNSDTHVQVQERGAETIVWSHPPTGELRNMVSGCLPR